MPILVKILLVIVAVVAVLGILLAIGLRVQPKPLAPFPQPSGPVKTVPLPGGLPAPVERYYRLLYGEQIPVIESVVLTGHGPMRPFGPFYFPARFRFTHVAGQGYRHYLELTLFGLPFFKVNERYMDGKSLFEIPLIGTEENEPKTNQGANLGLWAETALFPAVFLTDGRVEWKPVDDNTALLVVPFEDGHETFVARFDPETGLLSLLESMRYHAKDSDQKVLWINEARSWRMVDGRPQQESGAAIWLDQGTAWAVFTTDEIVYNVDVSEYIYQKGE
jgi:hypothetical protein